MHKHLKLTTEEFLFLTTILEAAPLWAHESLHPQIRDLRDCLTAYLEALEGWEKRSHCHLIAPQFVPPETISPSDFSHLRWRAKGKI